MGCGGSKDGNPLNEASAEEAAEQAEMKALMDLRMTESGQVAKRGINKVGFMTKQGSFRKNWLVRFFTLEDGKLSYFRTENDEVPLGIYVLSKCVLLPKDQSQPEMNEIAVLGHINKTFRMKCEREDATNDWREAIGSWCADEQ